MSKENKTSSKQEQGNDFIADVMRFYFKVNNSKLKDERRLKNQIEKVIKRLVERNKIDSKSVELFFGAVDDDFVFDRCRLRISFNCTNGRSYTPLTIAKKLLSSRTKADTRTKESCPHVNGNGCVRFVIFSNSY